MSNFTGFEKGNLSETKKTGRLGRGLGSLLGESVVETPSKEEKSASPDVMAGKPVLVAIEQLYQNPNQPRKEFNEEKLKELTSSIALHGIIQPIVAIKDSSGKFQIVAGERRWRAAQLAGLKTVPVVLQEPGERKSFENAIVENVQRHDLNPIEEATAYNNLLKKYNLTQAEVADRVGKDRATVANLLRILNLDPEVQQMVVSGAISLGHAKVLLAIDNKATQRRLARKTINDGLSVRALEKVLSKKEGSISASTATTTQAGAVALIKDISDGLQKKLGTKVDIDYNHGRGQINISFYSNEQLNEIVEKIGK